MFTLSKCNLITPQLWPTQTINVVPKVGQPSRSKPDFFPGHRIYSILQLSLLSSYQERRPGKQTSESPTPGLRRRCPSTLRSSWWSVRNWENQMWTPWPPDSTRNWTGFCQFQGYSGLEWMLWWFFGPDTDWCMLLHQWRFSLDCTARQKMNRLWWSLML